MPDPKEDAEGASSDVDVAPARGLDRTIEDMAAGTIAEHGTLAVGSEPLVVSLGEAATLLRQGQSNKNDSSEPGIALLESGDSLGRLEVGEILGRGAFGVVVAAYDPELKRKLAIKLLKPEVFESNSGRDAHKRLLREARAMAKISHVNVVTVHDIGTVDGQVYVAMEFVEGGNLGHWLAEAERSWQEILDVFVQAGRGLAAAHREGLVHRDFKPDNVLVNTRGEVRVADFGLVSISEKRGEALASEEEARPGSPESGDMDISRAGSLLGTPLYMSPEQHLGDEVTPASDQFAFCVALYSALYGRGPFPCQNYKELRKAVLAGVVLPVPTSTSVPRWIQAVVHRGLSSGAEDRYPSMPALLEALFDDPLIRRRRRLKLAGASVGGIALLAALFWSQGRKSKVCQNASVKLTQVWDGPMKTNIAGAFASGDRSAEFARFEEAIDSYTGEWVSVRTRVCEATHLLGEQSDSLLDQRMKCLDQRLHYLLQVLTQLEVGVEVQTLDNALKLAATLPALSNCTKRQALAAHVPLPESQEEQAKIASANRRIDEAQAHYDLGAQGRAIEILETTLEEPLDYSPTLARATILLGKSRTDLGDLDGGERDLRKSIEYGTQAGDDLLVAMSWLSLVHLDGIEREDYPQGYEHGEMARLAMVRGQAGELEMAQLERSRASLLIFEGKATEALALLNPLVPLVAAQGSKSEMATLRVTLGDAEGVNQDFEAALVHYNLALAHVESSLGKSHPENIYILNNMAVALKGNRDTEGARKALERSVELTQRSYGLGSRDLVPVLTNLGNIYRREGDIDAAKAVLRRAIRVGKATSEEDHPMITRAMLNLAVVLVSDKDFAGATKAFREVLTRAEASFKEDHPDRAMALNNLGESLLLEKKYEESLKYSLLARDMKTRIYGEDHPKIATTLASLGSLYEAMGNPSEGESYFEKALDIFHGAGGEDHPHTIFVLSALGRLHEKHGPARKAIPFLQRAVNARGDADRGLAQAKDRFALLRALSRTPSRASALSSARTLLEELGDDDTTRSLAKELQGWMDAQ